MDLSIIKQHKIWSDAFVYLTEVSNSNSLPYHNIKHTLDVFKNCYNLSFYEEIDEKSTIELCLAALFHDFNHSGGQLIDHQNIINALLALDGFFITHQTYNAIVDKNKISEIIKATQYPYVISDDLLSTEQKIIRDADMLQTFEEDWVTMIMFGLRKEMKKNMTEMIKIQIGFLENMKFYTKWAEEKYKSLKSRNLTDLQHLQSFYQKEDKFSFLVKANDISPISDMSPINLSENIWSVFINQQMNFDEINDLLKNKGLTNFEVKINDNSKVKEA